MIVGWDISTSIIGVCWLSNDGKYVASHHLDLRKTEGVLAKGDAARDFVHKMLASCDPGSVHIVEERLGNFAAGRTMLQTLMTLAAFNTLVSWFIHSCKGEIVYLHPSTTKSAMRGEGLVIPKGADKKKLTLEWVTNNVKGWKNDLNRNDKPQPWCFDRADAYCLAHVGYLRRLGAPFIGHGPRPEDCQREAGAGSGVPAEG